MPTIKAHLDWVQGILGDAQPIGSDGQFWSRAELRAYLNDGYRQLLTQSQAVRQWTALDVPGRFTSAITAPWEARHAQGGSTYQWTWSAPGYQCSSLWEVQFLEGVTPDAASPGLTQPWERAYLASTHVPYRFALPRDNERIAGLWYDHRRLQGVLVRELDDLETHWMGLGDYPIAWTQGVGPTRTFEVFEVVTAYHQAYSRRGDRFGIPRSFSGARTYTTATAQLYGIPRRLMSPDRQYLATQGTLGTPRDYHSSVDSLLILEVIGPEIPDLEDAQVPSLVPRQMEKYLRYYALARAWERQGEAEQPLLAALCTQIFQRGVRILQTLAWLTRKDETLGREPVGQAYRRRPPRVQLPSHYERVW